MDSWTGTKHVVFCSGCKTSTLLLNLRRGIYRAWRVSLSKQQWHGIPLISCNINTLDRLSFLSLFVFEWVFSGTFILIKYTNSFLVRDLNFHTNLYIKVNVIVFWSRSRTAARISPILFNNRNTIEFVPMIWTMSCNNLYLCDLFHHVIRNFKWNVLKTRECGRSWFWSLVGSNKGQSNWYLLLI
jgi:hypothetical protein